MPDKVHLYVSEIQAIAAVPRVLETVAALTGLRFVCIAHVTDTSWTACAVHDRVGFGLAPGDQLDVATTLCQEVHATREAVIIDSVRDDARYANHVLPALQGYQSYISIPLFRRDGPYFGTLCGFDPEPRPLSAGAVVPALMLFAELVSSQLDSERALSAARLDLFAERDTAQLREQFIAVLGHDLRTPVHAILNRAELLARRHDDVDSRRLLERIRASALRIAELIDSVVDFTRGRMGDGLALDLRVHAEVDLVLEQVVEELRGVYPNRAIVARIAPSMTLRCDPQRLAQLLSNLLKNALVHSDQNQPAVVRARIEDGRRADDQPRFVLEVSNGGPDLSPATIAHLFKPYWRATSRLGDDGLGLGLYIVEQIVRAHRGAISVASDAGLTTFTFSMPVT